MPHLYERLMGVHPERPGMPIDTFGSIISEHVRARLTRPQMLDAIARTSGWADGTIKPLDTTEQAEVDDLIVTVSGNTQTRLARKDEIRDVLMLAENRIVGYDTPQAVRTRLGVQTR